VWRSDLKPRRNVARNGSSVERHAGRVARKASPWIERLARVGYVAKGALYVVIGFLALREALGLGGETSGPSSAIRSIGSQPFGSLMVALLAAYQSDPSETRGLGEALESLQHQPLGSCMLATITVGLLLYGAFMFAVALCRRIEPA
jgi:Domain of Unknown Function (DUF1206)